MRSGLAVSAVVALSVIGGPAALADSSTSAKYVYEIWYEIERDMGPRFDLYFATLREAAPKLARSPERWVDAHPERNLRIVSLPAMRLGDYRSDRYNEAALRAHMGADAYLELAKVYEEAQLSRKSYIREYRTDLSVNREQHRRDDIWATEYTLITVEPGKEKQFERLWRTAASAYAKAFPRVVLTGAKTIVGGGPEYVLTRPIRWKSTSDDLPPPAKAVEVVFGSDAARTFADGLAQAVNRWETAVFEKTALDADGSGKATRSGK